MIIEDDTIEYNLLESKIKEELIKCTDPERKRIFLMLFGAALGSVPWVGGFLSAFANFNSMEKQVKSNQLYEQWLQEHSNKMKDLAQTLAEVINRLNEFPQEINERLKSDEYLQIVRKSFRSWDNADTQEKRDFIRMLLTNSGTNTLVPDDLIRLFLDWIDSYHEIHFAVIKVIYQNPGVTRYGIWKELKGTQEREDSLEADLFKLLIRDLTTGSVIRQHREVDYYGNYVKKTPVKSSNPSSTMKSAFDNTEGYELTELGKKFVHYTMNEVVPRIA